MNVSTGSTPVVGNAEPNVRARPEAEIQTEKLP
jgi:formaldehyde-activating enzyme involved in methanogenesis